MAKGRHFEKKNRKSEYLTNGFTEHKILHNEAH